MLPAPRRMTELFEANNLDTQLGTWAVVAKALAHREHVYQVVVIVDDENPWDDRDGDDHPEEDQAKNKRPRQAPGPRGPR